MVEGGCRRHLHQGNEHAVEIEARLFRIERRFRLAQEGVETLLHDLEADAGIACRQAFADEAIRDALLATVAAVEMVNEYVGVDEQLSAHSSLPATACVQP
jgi:hypothetical protein